MSDTRAFCVRCGAKLGPMKESGVERRGCEAACGYIDYDNPTPVVGAIVQVGEDVILVRPPHFPEKLFGLVTGFLERGERPEDGVVREVKEEIGLDAKVESLVGVHPFFMMNQVIITYHLTATGEIQLGEEIAAFKRVPIAKLRPWPMGTGEAVRDFLASYRAKVTTAEPRP
jgi:NAD+ diphosphatase